MAEVGALSEPVRPVGPDGIPDTDVMSRLAVRHDDSLENVATRLTLWDRQVNKESTSDSQQVLGPVRSAQQHADTGRPVALVALPWQLLVTPPWKFRL